MPRNGSGTYSLPGNSINPAVTGTTIESSAFNTTLPDIASALTQSMSKDGQTVPTGNLPMGGFKLTGLADGASAADSATYGQTLHSSGGNTIVGNQALSGDLAVNGNTVLSGNLTVTGTVIFTISTLALETLGVSSAASVTSLTITGTTNANVLNVASAASLGSLRAGTTALATASIASALVLGAASGAVSAGYINAKGYLIDGAPTTSVAYNYIGGLRMTNSSGAPNTQIDVAAGQCSDSTNAQMITYAGGALNLATTGANGLRAGALANNTDYAVFLITGASGTALFADTAITPGTRPAGYTTAYRRIGVFRTGGSATVLGFIQTGRNFSWKNPSLLTLSATGALATDTPTLKTVPLLVGKKWPVTLRNQITGGTAATSVTIWDPDESADQDPGVNVTPLGDLCAVTSAVINGGNVEVVTNTSSQYYVQTLANSVSYYAALRSWVDDALP